jgi:hypothetical protein
MASIDDGYLVESMTATVDVSTAKELARVIEDHEARRQRMPVRKARGIVARRLGAAPGTLENLRRFRLKSIPHWLMARIRSEFVAVLQSEVRRLEHEISIHIQAGSDHRGNDLAKAQAQIVAAKKILNAAVRSGGRKHC